MNAFFVNFIGFHGVIIMNWECKERFISENVVNVIFEMKSISVL